MASAASTLIGGVQPLETLVEEEDEGAEVALVQPKTPSPTPSSSTPRSGSSSDSPPRRPPRLHGLQVRPGGDVPQGRRSGGGARQGASSRTVAGVAEPLAAKPGQRSIGQSSRVKGLDHLAYPPENFAMVAPHIYRGCFPPKKSLGFIETLRLRSIVYLCPEEPPAYYVDFMARRGIRFLHHGLKGNKEPFVEIPMQLVADALADVVARANQPVYIHCDKGKHRTGCVVGCLRRMMHWCSSSIFEEYRRHAGPKGRTFDLQFIELFEVGRVLKRLDTVGYNCPASGPALPPTPTKADLEPEALTLPATPDAQPGLSKEPPMPRTLSLSSSSSLMTRGQSELSVVSSAAETAAADDDDDPLKQSAPPRTQREGTDDSVDGAVPANGAVTLLQRMQADMGTTSMFEDPADDIG